LLPPSISAGANLDLFFSRGLRGKRRCFPPPRRKTQPSYSLGQPIIPFPCSPSMATYRGTRGKSRRLFITLRDFEALRDALFHSGRIQPVPFYSTLLYGHRLHFFIATTSLIDRLAGMAIICRVMDSSLTSPANSICRPSRYP